MNQIQEQKTRNKLYLKSDSKDSVLERFIPKQLKDLSRDQTSIPKLAKDTTATTEIESILPQLPTHHNFYCADSTGINLNALETSVRRFMSTLAGKIAAYVAEQNSNNKI